MSTIQLHVPKAKVSALHVLFERTADELRQSIAREQLVDDHASDRLIARWTENEALMRDLITQIERQGGLNP